MSDGSSTPTIAFDLGGTWFRSALVYPDGTVEGLQRRPALGFRQQPERRPDELQQALVDYLAVETSRLRRHTPSTRVGISLGAALDGRTGFVYDSGPLWGPECPPFDLPAALRRRHGEARWHVANDITAALRWHVEQAPRPFVRATLLTVSTGIGCRTYDARTGEVPVDPRFGLQGEIGHLPVRMAVSGRLLSRRCDCGGQDHLNAFASGRGIEALLPELARLEPELFAGSSLAHHGAGGLDLGVLSAAAVAGDGFARWVVDRVTEPVAEMLLRLFTLDAEVDLVFLTGGVVHGLGEVYLRALCGHLERQGLYQISDREPDVFRHRLVIGRADDHAGLRGAALLARGAPRPVVADRGEAA